MAHFGCAVVSDLARRMVEHFAKPIAVVPSMMGIASAFALGARADAVAPPISRAATPINLRRPHARSRSNAYRHCQSVVAWAAAEPQISRIPRSGPTQAMTDIRRSGDGPPK
jgi:hypothetical protein